MRIFNKTPKPETVLNLGGGAFTVEFRAGKDWKDSVMKISTPSQVMGMEVRGWPYLYLRESARQGREDEILAYCVMMYRVAEGVYKDPVFAADIIRSVKDYDARLEAEGYNAAAKVTDSEEIISQTVMEEAAEHATASRRQRRKMRSDSRKEVKEALRELGDEFSGTEE